MSHPPAPGHLNGELVVAAALTSARQLGGVMLANYTSGTLAYPLVSRGERFPFEGEAL